MTMLTTSGTGNKELDFTAAKNTSISSRTGTLTIAGQTVTVTQSGSTSSSCTYTLSSTTQTVSSTGGSYTVTVSASPSGCSGSWTATSNVSFITITSGSSGTASGTVRYSVASNLSTSSRNGTLTIAGKTVTVTQGGSTPSTARIEGNYTLETDTASRCGFPFNTFRWSVVARVTWVIAGTITSNITLANGSNLLDMTIDDSSSTHQGVLTSITTLGMWGIPVENNTAYNFFSSAIGGVGNMSINSSGRAEVLSATLNDSGALTLILNNPRTLFDCPRGGTFGRWSLYAR